MRSLRKPKHPSSKSCHTLRLLPMAVMATLALTSIQAALAVPLLINGGFETGDLTGWTATSLGDGDHSLSVESGNKTPISSHPTVGPASGVYYAVSDQSGPSVNTLTQSFLVPAGATSVHLSYRMFANNYGGGVIVNPGGLNYTLFPNQHARVDLLTASASTFNTTTGVIKNLYLGADSAVNPNPYTSYFFDLTGLVTPGNSYQLRFAEVDNQGYLNLGVDDVNIDVNINANACGNLNSSTSVNGGCIDAYTLSFDIPNTVTGNVDVGRAGGAVDTLGNNGTISGVIGGAGSLTKVGAGVLTLTGANTYAGGTYFNGGTISVSSDANLGALVGALSFNGGVLQVTGTAFTGTNRTLNWGASGGGFDIADPANSFTVSQSLGGVGGLSKLGGGSLILTGANTYTGGTTVDGGILSVNGSLASGVTINPAGTLRGTGQINGPVNVSGKLAPGNSPGTLTANGPVTLYAGSTLQVDIDGKGTGNGAGNYSRLLVNSGSFTANGTLTPILRGITGSANNNFTPTIGDQFRIVTAQGGIQGRFAAVNQPSSGLAGGTRLDVFYNGSGSNSIDLFATPSSYANSITQWGGNNNARSVGLALDFMRGLDNASLATARQNELRYQLAGLRSAQITSFATALSGEVHGAMAAVAPETGRWLQGAVVRQLSGSPGSLEQAGLKSGNNVWLDFNASQGRTDSGSAANGYTASRYQFAIGVDILHSQTNRLGLGVTYASTSVGPANGHGTIEETAPFLYGQYGFGKSQKIILDGLFGYGFSTWQTDRADPLRRFGALKTNASGHGSVFSVGVRSPFAVGYGLSIEPFTRVLWQGSSRNAVSEGLASPSALSLASYGLNGTRLLVGAAVGSDNSDPLATPFTYRASVAFGEDFGDLVYPTVQASLAGAGFQINAPKAGREFGQLNLSATYQVIDSAYLYVGLNGEAREHRLDGGVNAGFNFKF